MLDAYMIFVFLKEGPAAISDLKYFKITVARSTDGGKV